MLVSSGSVIYVLSSSRKNSIVKSSKPTKLIRDLIANDVSARISLIDIKELKNYFVIKSGILSNFVVRAIILI